MGERDPSGLARCFDASDRVCRVHARRGHAVHAPVRAIGRHRNTFTLLHRSALVDCASFHYIGIRGGMEGFVRMFRLGWPEPSRHARD